MATFQVQNVPIQYFSGLLVLVLKDPDITTYAQCCCGTLQDLCTAISRKCHVVLMMCAMLQHDDDHPHLACPCPGHTVLHELAGVEMSLTLPCPVTM